ncbi:MAG: FIST N-terminal domain-containing protein [Betaproteobacteria bacterium]
MTIQQQSIADRFAYAHAASPHWRIAAAECLERIGPVAPEANLGFVYVTDHYAGRLGELLTLLKTSTGVEHWIGTVGIGICATGREYLDEGAMALMLGAFAPGTFRVLPSIRTPSDLARDPLTIGGTAGNFALVHADPRNASLEPMLSELSKRLESGFVVGGLTSSRATHGQIADGIDEGGLSGAVFTDQVVVSTRHTQGCSPLGIAHVITDSQRNVVIELDGRPALDVLREDAALHDEHDLDRVGGTVFAALPVSGSALPDYLVRNVVGLDAQRGLVAVAENVRRGEKLMFCRRDKRSATEDMSRMLDSMKSGLYTRPRGAVYFSCLGRGASLFGENSKELAMISESLGDVPLVGFYCNGEITHNRLYGYTGVLTLFL